MHNKFDFSGAIHSVKEAKLILIIGHINPDGDALGSGLALYNSLLSEGKTAYIIMPNEFPQFLDFLPSSREILRYSRHAEKIENLFKQVDLIISVDHNAPNRTGGLEELVRKSNARKILFDHHIEPDYASYDWVYQTERISSTSELMYHFLSAYAGASLSKEIATCIYTGMMTDTGSFSYACPTPDTYHIAGKLQELGADIEYIHQQVFFNYPENRMRLLGYSLSNKLIVKKEYKTAYIYLSKDELERFDYHPGDTEGLVNWALSLEGILFAALFKELKEKIRISFRSQGNFSVNEFAAGYFEGGGHKHAAGGSSKKSLQETLAFFESLLPELSIE